MWNLTPEFIKMTQCPRASQEKLPTVHQEF